MPGTCSAFSKGKREIKYQIYLLAMDNGWVRGKNNKMRKSDSDQPGNGMGDFWLQKMASSHPKTAILVLANKPDQWLSRSQQRVTSEQVEVLWLTCDRKQDCSRRRRWRKWIIFHKYFTHTVNPNTPSYFHADIIVTSFHMHIKFYRLN